MSGAAFRRLLKWLSTGSNSGGEEYLRMHRRLADYFERKRCSSPDDLADETLNRVARRLQEAGHIDVSPPARYCYIVARFVFLESYHRARLEPVSLEGLSVQESGRALGSKEGPSDALQAEEKRHDCLDRCLSGMDAVDRELIVQYYRGEQREKITRRQSMAGRFGVTANALSIRACRIRRKLEACVRQCMEAKEGEAAK